jgi:tRNA A37 threonylcarbamoyladenosine dehydratase
MKFKRCVDLFGESNFTKISSKKVIILGVGGVGGFVLDCLYRTGVGDITIVDCDIFDESNQNRQIGSNNINSQKIDILSQLYQGVYGINQKIDEEWVDSFDFDRYDIVVDAIDDISAKVALAKKTYKKLICSAGSAKRIDPSFIKFDKISNIKGDKFLKKFKLELEKSNFNRDFWVVYSDEPPKCKQKGSFVGVTASFGLRICSEIIKKFIKG